MHHNSSDSSEKAPVESVVIDLLINEFALLCNIFLLLLFESWFDITDRNLLFILVLRCLAVDGSLSVVWYYFGERNWQSEHACLRAQRRCWLLRWALLSMWFSGVRTVLSLYITVVCTTRYNSTVEQCGSPFLIARAVRFLGCDITDITYALEILLM